MSPTVVLITGANRGIGRGLLELYLARANHRIIATVRDPNHSTAKKLTTLPRAEETSLVVVKLDVTVHSDPAAAVQELSAKHGIDHVDVLVANAGIALKWPTVSEVTPQDIQKHVEVNVHGFVVLFQAFRPVLQKAKDPKWVTIGSSAAFLTVSSPSPERGHLFSLLLTLSASVVSNVVPILFCVLLTPATPFSQQKLSPHAERGVWAHQAGPALAHEGHPHRRAMAHRLPNRSWVSSISSPMILFLSSSNSC